MTGNPLWAIVAAFAPFSLLMFGGANAIIPEIHRQAVEVRSWLSDDEFATLFAVAQAAPGPNIRIVSLIGWHVAGIPGLLAATIAINVPHCLLTFGIGRAVAAVGDAPWSRVIKDVLVPVPVGLIVASGVVKGRAADHALLAVCISAATAAFIVFTNRNPMWMLCAGMGVSLAIAHRGVLN